MQEDQEKFEQMPESFDNRISIAKAQLLYLSWVDIDREPFNDEKRQELQPFIQVKISGDGNCGFASVAFAFLWHVISGDITLTEDQYQPLLKAIQQSRKLIEQRHDYFAGKVTQTLEGENFRGGQYDELVEPINEFLTALDREKINNFEQFKWIKFTVVSVFTP